MKNRLVAFLLTVTLALPLLSGSMPVVAQSAQVAGDCAVFSSDLNYPDGSIVAKNTWITKRWQLYNCGTTNWKGYSVRKQYGTLGPGYFTIDKSAAGGAYIEVYATFNTGTTAGRYISGYRLYNKSSQAFGETFYFDLTVR